MSYLLDTLYSCLLLSVDRFGWWLFVGCPPSAGASECWRTNANDSCSCSVQGAEKSHLCWDGILCPAKLLINDNFITNSEQHNRMNLSLKWIRLPPTLSSFFTFFFICRLLQLIQPDARMSVPLDTGRSWLWKTTSWIIWFFKWHTVTEATNEFYTFRGKRDNYLVKLRQRS